jgi:hypothetical protein
MFVDCLEAEVQKRNRRDIENELRQMLVDVGQIEASYKRVDCGYPALARKVGAALQVLIPYARVDVIK